MTPSPRGEQALRAITVQSLADLGYGVDVTHADAYFLRGAVSAKVSAKDVVKPETPCAVNEVQEPIFVVDELGISSTHYAIWNILKMGPDACLSVEEVTDT